MDKGFTNDKAEKKYIKYLVENVWYSGCTIVWDDVNNNNDFAPLDILFTAITSNGKEYKKAIEHKGREYTAQYLLDKGGYALEKDKYAKMVDYENSGYTVYYYNSFKDGIYYLWRKDGIDRSKKDGFLYAKKHTYGNYKNEKPINKPCYYLDNKEIIFSGRTDGRC